MSKNEGLTMNQLAEINAQHVTTIASLEAKCAALAAENESIKFYLRNGPLIRKDGELAAAHQFAPETPATDSFLAEVRAQGVELFARSLRGEAEITKACTFKPVQQFEEFAYRADECAAQLRQDANIAELVAAGIITRIEG